VVVLEDLEPVALLNSHQSLLLELRRGATTTAYLKRLPASGPT
jgi:hypothetical protein